ncbi:hypothetical protein [Alysiella crassa]|nr:hypothetical protein [Alysiella crassa]
MFFLQNCDFRLPFALCVTKLRYKTPFRLPENKNTMIFNTIQAA